MGEKIVDLFAMSLSEMGTTSRLTNLKHHTVTVMFNDGACESKMTFENYSFYDCTFMSHDLWVRKKA